MAKIVFSYVAIFCLLILVSANTITTSLKKTTTTECADLGDDSEDIPVPSPVEEDNTGEDIKLGPQQTHLAVNRSSSKLIFSNCFLTSFHFLEIISPPPQG